jgi:hypothetical protein
MKRPGDFQEGVEDPQLVKAVVVASKMLKEQGELPYMPGDAGLVWKLPS